MRAPDFWQRREAGPAAALLAPLGAVYGLAARARQALTRPWQAPVPVICVGNLTVGGAGKTPVALDLGQRLAAAGRDAHFVTRGYGGRHAGPVRVDPAVHGADAVGDEPLLLARVRPTWVSRDRPAGIRAAVNAGATAVVLDDGYQNPTFAKDIGLVVVDGRRGFGNGRVIPAGPLREPVESGLARAAALVIVGADEAGLAARAGPIPVLHCRLEPDAGAGQLAERPVVAFAGIGHPDKVFETLRNLGCTLIATRPFPDHHPYSAGEVAAMLDEAEAAGAVAVTTQKDAVRLPRELAARVAILAVRVVWADEAALDRVLAPVLGPSTTRR